MASPVRVQVTDYGLLGGKLSSRASGAVPATKKDLVRIMRRGMGSVDDQFRRQGSMGQGDRFKQWPKTKPFGKVEPPTRTLKRTGQYLAAWRGESAGSFTYIRPLTRTLHMLEIGVDPTRFPQAKVLMANAPTRIRVTPKMRVFLGVVKGVWLKKGKTHIVIPPRPFKVSGSMVSRVSGRLIDYIVRGS
jgi:hypothetical protein